jgi:hypothetical protein
MPGPVRGRSAAKLRIVGMLEHAGAGTRTIRGEIADRRNAVAVRPMHVQRRASRNTLGPASRLALALVDPTQITDRLHAEIVQAHVIVSCKVAENSGAIDAAPANAAALLCAIAADITEVASASQRHHALAWRGNQSIHRGGNSRRNVSVGL